MSVPDEVERFLAGGGPINPITVRRIREQEPEFVHVVPLDNKFLVEPRMSDLYVLHAE